MKDSELVQDFEYVLKWGFCSTVMGLLGGVIGALFVELIRRATLFRTEHPWMLFLMPVAGLIIVFFHDRFGAIGNRGTNLVLESISGDQPIDRQIPPLIFVSTVLSHLVGASAGREGAALQIGGGIGTALGEALKLSDKDRKTAVMAGMSAMFAAVFGTPVAAVVFPIEVISIGVMYYSALVPCTFASFIGLGISRLLGTGFEHFKIASIPGLSLYTVSMVVILGILSGLLSNLFCRLLHGADHLYARVTQNAYLRILLASLVFILLTLLCRTDRYEGAGGELIAQALDGTLAYEAFLLKMLFTAIALGGKFKGGEIVPVFAVGAGFGCTFGRLTGFSPSLCASCGLAAVFAGATNCPISTLMIALEMMSPEGISYYAFAIALSYVFSGYTGLYGSQRILYSKTASRFINRKAS